MVKRLFVLSLMVLVLCVAGTMISTAGGPVPRAAAPQCMPAPPCIPPVCGPAATSYSAVKEEIVPVPAQLRKVRVVAPYLAGVAWPRTPLAFYGNPQTFPNPIAVGRYEWLVPAVEVKNEHFDTFMDPCCKTHKVPRCVYVKANYVKTKPACGNVPMGPPPALPMFGR